MDKSELAQKMLKWEQLTLEANKLAAEIEDAVFEIGETQTVGNVRVTYRKGRKSWDFETPGMTADSDIIEKYTTIKTLVDWKSVCNDAGLNPVLKSQSPPSVRIKLME